MKFGPSPIQHDVLFLSFVHHLTVNLGYMSRNDDWLKLFFIPIIIKP